MRVLFSLPVFNAPFDNKKPVGGGELSVYALIQRLANDADVFIACSSNYIKSGKFKIGNISIFNRSCKRHYLTGDMGRYFQNLRWIRELMLCISEIGGVDILISQSSFIPATCEVARRLKIPSVLFVRAYENMPNNEYDYKMKLVIRSHFTGRRAIKQLRDWTVFPFSRILNNWNKKSFKNADLVIANSKFMAGVVNEYFGVKPFVVYPFINKQKIIADNRQPFYITFVKPTIEKGVTIFIEIAKRMPNMRFLCVGNAKEYGSTLEKLKNVELVGWSSDMRKVYARTKILLVPSLCSEAFGRVAAEAIMNGIPCVVSNRGGLPEVVGDSGIIIQNPFDIMEWVSNLSLLLTNQELFDELIKRCQTRAQIFCIEKQYRKFFLILDGLLYRRELYEE